MRLPRNSRSPGQCGGEVGAETSGFAPVKVVTAKTARRGPLMKCHWSEQSSIHPHALSSLAAGRWIRRGRSPGGGGTA
jgi:hypothetical protein